MSSIVKCKTCGKDVSSTAPTCPHCGEASPGLDVSCPRCGSSSISIQQKGFGLGKAAAGAILLGPLGLAGGMVGRKKPECVCGSCGHHWDAHP